MKKTHLFLIVLVGIFGVPSALLAHPGRTDSNGGHYNHKTGEYHYHNGVGSNIGIQESPDNTEIDRGNKKPSRISAPLKPISDPNKSNSSDGSTQKIKGRIEPVQITENHWQVALNNKVFQGRLEVTVSTGRVDIVTDSMVVEVDKVSKYQEGVEQALKYAEATGKMPVLALYLDGEKDGYELLKQAEKLCIEKKVSFILANSYVSVNDLIEMLTDAGVWEPPVESVKSENPLERKTVSDSIDRQGKDLNYWITNSSGVRHNSSCRFYKNSNGRACSRDEGRACEICGG